MKLFSDRNGNIDGLPVCAYTMSQYSLLTDDMVRTESRNLFVVNPSTKPTGTDRRGNPTFARGTVFDPRFGVQNEGEVCPTCAKGFGECPGHMGCIQLACQVILWDSNEANQICASLSAFLLNSCAHCGTLTTKPRECVNCQRKVKRVTFRQSDATIGIAVPVGFVDEAYIEYTAAVMQPKRMDVQAMAHLAAIVYQQMQGDKQETCLKRFGCCDPRALFYNTIAVPPPMHRLEKTSPYDPVGPYTKALINIVKTNRRLQQLQALYARAQSSTPEERVANVQTGDDDPPLAFDEATKASELAAAVTLCEKEMRVRAFALHNVCPGSSFKGCWNAMTGGTCEGSKESAFRQDIMGKRITNVTRAVIRGDATLALDEVGVPAQVARQLEVQTPVTPVLASMLLRRIETGQWGDSGRDWRRIRQVSLDASIDCKVDVALTAPLSRADRDQLCELLYALEQGRVSTSGTYLLLHRGLIDGDTVLANRNPSLHRANIQALRVRVDRGKDLQNTIAFNPEQASLFQLDFDGDMMMLAVPGDTWAVAEAKVLHRTATLIVNANGRLLCKPAPNTVLGLYALTDPLWADQEATETLSVFDTLFESIGMQQITTLHHKHTTKLAERARQRIVTSDGPRQQAVAELMALCLPDGIDLHIPGCAGVGGWKTDEAAARGTAWTATCGAQSYRPPDVWEKFRAAGALSTTIALTTDGAVSHGYTEWVDADSAAAAVERAEWVGILTWQKPDRRYVEKKCKKYSLHFGSSLLQSETVPLIVKSGQVCLPVPRLTRNMIATLMDQLYRCTLDTGVMMASARALQNIGNTYLTMEAPCCAPADVRDAAQNDLSHCDCTLLPVGATWGMQQYNHSHRELAMTGDALRAPVLSGAKGSLNDLRAMMGSVGSVRAGFLDETADPIFDNFLHGLTTTSYMQSQRVGTYQDLKTKTEIGHLGYIYKQLILLCSKAVTGCRGEVVVHHQSRVRMIQLCYNGDALDPHCLAGSGCVLNTLTDETAVENQYNRALRSLQQSRDPRDVISGRLRLIFPPPAKTDALVDQIEQTITAAELCDILGESLQNICPDFWLPVLGWWMQKVRSSACWVQMESVSAAALVVLACFDALADCSVSSHIIPWQHLWNVAENSGDALGDEGNHDDYTSGRQLPLMYQLVNEHARRFAENRKSGCSQTRVLRFHKLVHRRWARCRIEHGTPVGMYVSESMMTDLEQAALNLKHQLGEIDIKATFKHLVELVYPHQKLVQFETTSSAKLTLVAERKVRDLTTIVARLFTELSDEMDPFGKPVLRFVHRPSDKTVGVAVRMHYHDSSVLSSLPGLHNKNGLSLRTIVDEQLQHITVTCIDEIPVSAASSVTDLIRTLHQTGWHDADTIFTACEQQFPQTQTLRLLIDTMLMEKVATKTQKWWSTLDAVCEALRNTTCKGTPRVRSVEPINEGMSKVCMINVKATSRVQRPLMSQLELMVGVFVTCAEVHVVNDALGIEAARSLLHTQLQNLFADTAVSKCHITLLCDLLTLDGKPRGIRRVDAAADRTPLELVSFEEGRKAFTDAALRGWSGDEDSVQHATVFNRPAQLGTGLITVAPTAAQAQGQQVTIWGHEVEKMSSYVPAGCDDDLTIFQDFDL